MRRLAFLLPFLFAIAGSYWGWRRCLNGYHFSGEGGALAYAVLWPVYLAYVLGAGAVGLLIGILLWLRLRPRTSKKVQEIGKEREP